MSKRNRARRQRTPQRTPDLAPGDPRAEAAMWRYVLAAWRSPEPPECDAETAAMMAGCILGQRVRVGMELGMTREDATAAVLARAEELAAWPPAEMN